MEQRHKVIFKRQWAKELRNYLLYAWEGGASQQGDSSANRDRANEVARGICWQGPGWLDWAFGPPDKPLSVRKKDIS